jgi:hypothetical protein
MGFLRVHLLKNELGVLESPFTENSAVFGDFKPPSRIKTGLLVFKEMYPQGTLGKGPPYSFH